LDSLDGAKFKNLISLKYFLIAGVVFLAIDFSHGGYKIATMVMPFGEGMLSRIIWLMVSMLMAFSIIYAVSWLLRDNLPIILLTVFGTIFVSTVTVHLSTDRKNQNITFTPSKGGRENLPPVIHIILDEMIGAEGIDRDIPGGEETYQIVRNFHSRFKFRLYGKAFSRHISTSMSIPNMLNYDYTDSTYGTTSRYLTNGKWKYFDDMGHQGYDINVYQTSHINFCNAGNITRCKTLNSFNPAGIYVSFPKKDVSHPLSMNAIVFSLFMQKMPGSYFSAVANRLNRLPLGHRLMKLMGLEGYFVLRYDVQSFNLWFDEISKEITQTRGGEVFFTHFLTPHMPLILNKHCNIKSIPWYSTYNLKQIQKLNDDSFREARRAYYKLYYEQVSCVFNKLTVLMKRIEDLKQFKNATIIIHGDHGSRISAGQFFEGLSDRDLVDNYSTLFSIRSPDWKTGYDTRSVSVQRLFTEILSGEHNITLMDRPDTIAVNSKDTGRVISVKMPVFGTPSPTSEK